MPLVLLLCHFREGCIDQAEALTSAPQVRVPSDDGESRLSRSGSSSSWKSDSVKLTNPVQDIFIQAFSSNSNGHGVKLVASPSNGDPGESSAAQNLLVGPGSYHERDSIAQGSPSSGSVISSCYSSPAFDSLQLSLQRTTTRERRLELNQSKHSGASDQSSPPSVLVF